MTSSLNYSARVSNILLSSIAEEVGFKVGDTIISINGTAPRDLIDYNFLCSDVFLLLQVLDTQGVSYQVEIEKDYDEDLGLEFETALFDGLIQCNNRCPFCFIDQQPLGKRDSLYLKDDDYRLSFLYGSYLTLTNLTKKEWKRIENMRLSPLFVSVHAIEPDIRVKLLKNERAGEIKRQLQWFRDKRLQIHAQIVVCPGINDGIHLEKTLLELAEFHSKENPTVISTAVVPVGLTRFRPRENELIPVDETKSKEVIRQVQLLQKKFLSELNSHFVWLADEWFLIAKKELPPEFHYEDYPQISNGVGSIRKFIKEFYSICEKRLPIKIDKEKTLIWVVGNAVEKVFQPLVKKMNQVENLTVTLVALKSEYWGQEITVTGLLTGKDLISGLQNIYLGDGVLIPSVMLKNDNDIFLDDTTIQEISSILKTSLIPIDNITNFIEICLSE
ncbi:MAG: putative FeS-containing Cyanobacterial-specific oxidoreductase [Candidatus Atelocyanobacterium thalassa isolate SIO64986]|uniref:Putative FeS-containing Cyanobacterial-specific oxidoreductase n=1 Tax=Candidatus Atelocyanobacterium thalassa isolate SIO64986 TaxID=1527444 RepID=A0A086CIV5_9CHRO|nr:MAG: putative FeS-containing Cyanobacterial-specific oxidoreductase [Candidatus Atelocyanobacterium thalassa isolate SIO64986]